MDTEYACGDCRSKHQVQPRHFDRNLPDFRLLDVYKRQVLHGAVALGVPGFLIPGVLRLHMVRIMLVVVHPLDFLKAEIRLLRVLPELVCREAPIAVPVDLSLIHIFQNGADDYVVKPFDLAVLYSRILALLRRTKTITDTKLFCDDLMLDKEKTAVYDGQKEIVVSQPEYRILLRCV